MWHLSGGTLCAAAEDAWEDFGLEFDAVNIGGAHFPSLELLLSSDPDLVIASASTASNVEMKDTLEAAGITVIYFDVDNFDDYLYMLDICHQIQLMKLLRKLADNGKGIVTVMHDLPLSFKFSDEILVMDDGKIQAVGKPAEICEKGVIKQVFDIQIRQENDDFFLQILN